MEKTYILVEGPIGAKKKNSFVAVFDGTDIEVLGETKSVIGIAKSMQRRFKLEGPAFNLSNAARGYTYYEKKTGKLTKDKAQEFRNRFPFSSSEGLNKTSKEKVDAALAVRSRAFRSKN